ncbi:P-type conjugative transfer protein VirB9 [Bradyrhizobium brasilense]|uniref:P-type conjugative transfer protein VirB9 n=1 Tax=Bradyrhizobium brasilense TaxID=1419277 RepID=UPI001E4323EF|nr:P-type conjugative transfer protein VirB9 [Bradyrhizobium brasilense]MCC8976135.1 P-type conjugative transfer protein VirB9 [Bradyrhizobium brasilense]
MRSIAVFIAFLATAVPVRVLALDVPKEGARDERVRSVSYDPNQVVKVVGRYKSSTQIVFAPTEEIADVGLGNTVAWEVAPAGNSIFLKPREKQPPTNMQVVTIRQNGERRSYQFELEAIEAAGKGKQAFFLVRFHYPEDEAAVRRQRAEQARSERDSQAVDATLALHQRFGARNWRYSAQGARDLQPDAIYDDGKVTTLRFAGNREVPAIYTIQGVGQESLVPYDARDNGETIVIHATARELRLRRGDDVLCVFNEAFDAVGVNPATGTTSPSVQRGVKAGKGRFR